LNTDSPKADKVIELSTSIRQSVALDLDINNPLKHAITFEIIINGEGLQGENILHVGAQETVKYSLIYSPLSVGHQKGSIAFINEVLGEIWYELDLTSEE
jgi:hypothetical protein